MAKLFGRSIKLQVDTIVLQSAEAGGHAGGKQGLHVIFKATKTLKSDPNTCEVQIYNLTPDHRAQLTKKKLPVVSLAAGYGDALTQLFLGEMLHVSHERKDADVITTISTTDGGESKQKGRVNVSFGPKASPAAVLQAIVKSLGVKPGNMPSVLSKLSLGLPANMFISGATISGNAARELDTLCRSAGLEWSIQDGALQFLNTNVALAKFAIVLNKESGLIGTPSVNSKGIVNGQSLIIKDMLPGRQVSIESEFLTARARLLKCEYSGDTRGDTWNVDFEADTKVKLA